MSVPISMWWPVSNNFGDLIGPYIMEKLTGRTVMYAESGADYAHYVFGGSVLNHVNDRAIVWGSGLGTITDGVNPRCTIAAIRGPISRARAISVGRECPDVYGDPGMLMPRFHKPAYPKSRPIGLVPHYVDQYRAYDRYKDVCVINVFNSIGSVIDEICSCERIFSSSLHGIIIAHAYGIPAAWVKLSDSVGGDGTKFRDYFLSVGLDVQQPIDIRDGGGLDTSRLTLPKVDISDRFLNAFPLPV